MMYIYLADKPSSSIHILDEEGKTLCKAENGWSEHKPKNLTAFIPDGRKLCTMCGNVLKRTRPHLYISVEEYRIMKEGILKDDVRHYSAYHEDYGAVVWYKLSEPYNDAPEVYCGTPLDSDWPGVEFCWWHPLPAFNVEHLVP